MKIITMDLVKYNQDETKGFRVDDLGSVIMFEERKLFLKNCSNKTPAPKAGTSRSTEAEKSAHSPSVLGKKRKVNQKVEAGESSSSQEAEIRAKRIKNKAEQEKVETSVEELLFANDLLLRSIFPCLNVEDLKSCRLVNRLWCLEATKILLKRDSLATIEISDTLVAFQDAFVYKIGISFQDFQNIIANSKLFPCPNFGITNLRLSSNIISFFRDYGPLVKSFCYEAENITYLSMKKVKPRMSTAYHFLLLAAKHLPNLKILKFKGRLDTPHSDVMEMAIDLAPEMKNLRTLEIDGEFQTHVISLILKKAYNLESIYYNNENYYPIGFNKLSMLGNAIPRLKNMLFVFGPNSLDILQYVLEQTPRITTIEKLEVDPGKIPDTDLAEVGLYLTKLFHQSSESLTRISGMDCLGHIPQLSIPVLPNVKELQIEYSLAPLLPSGFTLAQVFPNLTTVKLRESINFPDREEILPERWSPLLSVRHLEVMDNDKTWIERIHYLFPNVTSAKFRDLRFYSEYENIWRLSKLQDLHLELLIVSKPTEEFHELDSVITGFSLEAVKSLWEKNEEDFSLTEEDIAARRIKPSIVDLKELRKLSLGLVTSYVDDGWSSGDDGEEDDYDGDSESDNEDNFRLSPSCKRNVDVIFDPGVGKALLRVDEKIILSYTSKLFGFDLCPQLNSNVSVGFKHFTRCLNPYADSILLGY